VQRRLLLKVYNIYTLLNPAPAATYQNPAMTGLAGGKDLRDSLLQDDGLTASSAMRIPLSHWKYSLTWILKSGSSMATCVVSSCKNTNQPMQILPFRMSPRMKKKYP